MSELGDKLAQHFKPDGKAQWDNHGKTMDERLPCDGSDSTMIVFRDTDGMNSMRALTFDEIAEALVQMDKEARSFDEV